MSKNDKVYKLATALFLIWKLTVDQHGTGARHWGALTTQERELYLQFARNLLNPTVRSSLKPALRIELEQLLASLATE